MSDNQEDPTIPMPPKKRVRGPNKKKKRVRRVKPAPDPASLPEMHAAVASVEGVGDSELAALRAQVADLNAKLDTERTARTEAEAAALAAATSQTFLMQREIKEIPTGKTVKVKRAKGYEVKGYKDNGQDVLKPIWHEVDMPTFYYRIDLPPCGGTDLKINGEPYYHGATYEFDADTLRTVKDIVHRCWAHDASIHGTDENFYRRIDPAYQARNAGIVQLRR